MEQLKSLLDELQKNDANWLIAIKNQRDNDIPLENKKVVSLFNEFWHVMREYLKTDYSGAVSFFENEFSSEDKWLLDDIQQSLQAFFSLTYFRKLQKQDQKKAKTIIKYLWENAIVLFDPQFANAYLEFGFDNPDTFVSTARTLDGLISYYVHRHFTLSAIKADLKDETEIDDSICDYIVSLIENDYQKLQMNVIIDGLRG